MSVTNKVITGIKYPALTSRFLYRKMKGSGGNPSGIDIFSQDWDNLIILDACRADFFRDVVSPELNGVFDTVESKGTATVEWVRENFSGQTLDDTVYVSANGWLHQIAEEIEAEVYAADWIYTSEFRNEMGTVPPGIVTKRALRFHKKHPKKRLIVHYVQPHKPFLGETAKKHFTHAEGINMHEMMTESEGATVSDLQSAYRETLEEVVPEVNSLVSELAGKTVISADHGELLGERYPTLPFKNYGHPVGIYVPELIKVPWFECEWDTRRKIYAEEPRNDTRMDEELQEHLRAMGYK